MTPFNGDGNSPFLPWVRGSEESFPSYPGLFPGPLFLIGRAFYFRHIGRRKSNLSFLEVKMTFELHLPFLILFDSRSPPPFSHRFFLAQVEKEIFFPPLSALFLRPPSIPEVSPVPAPERLRTPFPAKASCFSFPYFHYGYSSIPSHGINGPLREGWAVSSFRKRNGFPLWICIFPFGKAFPEWVPFL